MSPIVKKRGEKFTLPSKYLLFILTVVCLFLMVLTFNTNLFNGVFGRIVGYVVVPFQKGISSVGSWLNDRSDELSEIQDLIEENEKLKAQIDQLTIDITGLQQDKYELNNLRELYQLDAQYDEYNKIGARIIARDAGNWYASFVIDKGTDDGIKKNMNVMAGSGLVGIVVDVGPNWAKVTSIIADNSNVSGKVLSTADNLIVSGNLELMANGVISFSQLIDSENQVVEGDKVVTSSISDKYLPGILIGYIKNISADSNNLTKSGQLTPAVDFEHLEEVLVITELKQQVEE